MADSTQKVPNDRVGSTTADRISSKGEQNWEDLPYPEGQVGTPAKDANNQRALRLIGKKGV